MLHVQNVCMKYFALLFHTIQRVLLSSSSTHLSIILCARRLFTFLHHDTDPLFLDHLLCTAVRTPQKNSVKWKIDAPPAKRQIRLFCLRRSLPLPLSLSLWDEAGSVLRAAHLIKSDAFAKAAGLKAPVLKCAQLYMPPR